MTKRVLSSMWPLALVLIGLLPNVLGCRRTEVVRVVDGVEAPGRFISDRAYATFLLGAEWEARARYEDALSAYVQAARSDPDSVEIYSRIGWLSCMLDHGAEAGDAFDRALDLDPRYEPVFRRRARCAEHEGRLDDAVADSARAVALDPERDETVMLHARLLAAVDRADEAWPWLRDLSLRSPNSEEVWEAIAEHARRSGRAAWAQEAGRRLQALRERLGPSPTRAQERGWFDVDAALVVGDVEEARRRARSAHLDGRLLAARAIVVGRPQLAFDEAKLRVDADPADPIARVVMALAADLLGDAARVETLLSGLDVRGARLGPVASALFAELLLRHVGPDAAALFVGGSAREMTAVALRRRARDAFERGRPGQGR